MEERQLRIGSLFEWAVAALGVLVAAWLISVPLQRVLGPQVEAARVDAALPLPAGVPPGATSVQVMLLLDGREIRVGELHARISQMLSEQSAVAPIVRSREDGERETHVYEVDGTRFYVVCERTEPGAPLRVSGVYLP